MLLITIQISHQHDREELTVSLESEAPGFSFEKGLREFIEQIMKEKIDRAESRSNKFCIWKICSHPLKNSQHNNISKQKKPKKILPSDIREKHVLLKAFYKIGLNDY